MDTTLQLITSVSPSAQQEHITTTTSALLVLLDAYSVTHRLHAKLVNHPTIFSTLTAIRNAQTHPL